MTNAFEILGIKPGLTFSDDELRSAFREAGRIAHPDAGGDEAEFARLREALETITSPSRRLKHWLELRGTPADPRGAVAPSLMDLFAVIGETSQQAESVIRRRGETKSALALALLERDTQLCREAVEKAIQQVESAIEAECAAFPAIENAGVTDVESASMTARNLAFLEKWRAALRSLFARLV